MANLQFLNVFCRNGHYKKRMFFCGFDFSGAARYRCGICGCIRRYRRIFGQIKRVS